MLITNQPPIKVFKQINALKIPDVNINIIKACFFFYILFVKNGLLFNEICC